MPSEKALDDVIVQKQKEISKLLTTIQAHKQEAETLARLVRDRRAESAAAAKQQLKDLQREIPELEGHIQSKKNEIARLDDLIATRKEAAEKANKTMEAHFKGLESNLNEGVRKERALNATAKAELSAQEENLKVKGAALATREAAVNTLENNLREARSAHEAHVKAFEAKKAEELGAISKEKSRLAEQARALDTKETNLDSEWTKLIDGQTALRAQQDAAAAILVRIDEADKVLAKAVEYKAAADAKQVSINEANVKLLADTQRLNLRVDQVAEKERKLKEREANIAVIEARLSK